MGCDIHFNVEVKQNGKWKQNTEPVFPNHYYKPDGKSDWNKNEFDTSPSEVRSYDFFSILADVRNGRGFAGIKTGEGFAVIAEPRGVPSDATPEWLEYVERWGCDLHSISWLDITDFDNFDWNQVTMKTGVISLEQYKKLKNSTEAPNAWCGGISGGNNITISAEHADKVLAGKIKNLTRTNRFDDESLTKPIEFWDISVQYSWPVVYSEWFEHRIKEVVEPLRKLSEKYEDARLVFGFDN